MNHTKEEHTEKQTGPEVIKLFFMLKSVEHEILKAHKLNNIKELSFLQTQINREYYFSCS